MKFFRPFYVLYLVLKQALKRELPKKWRLHILFHVLLLDHDMIRKKRIDKNVIELEAGNIRAYEVKSIRDSMVCAIESVIIYQGFTSWCVEIAIQKKKIHANFYQCFSN